MGQGSRFDYTHKLELSLPKYAFLLRIEAGRHARNHIERHNRLCTLCNTRYIEDEYHFYLCPIYSNLRKRYILPYFYKRSSTYKSCILLNTTDFDKLLSLAKFANYAFSLRKH